VVKETYYQRNKEKIKLYSSDYYQKNKEKILAENKLKRKNARASEKELCKKNREKLEKYIREYMRKKKIILSEEEELEQDYQW